ncbi:saccharopine dehydrogenase [Salinadaptatus halalkaliphilus]|uniref:Saccharopine dehydrogenase n=1 Tax=Salinadaptatus halalkaliphilus TaxID=2419781 RepID=A0A4V3VL53_9EURY|nr:saccharopine dehydrogenase NADP-binding domain-containing protein [Salinadaptatus halalkaliphilus]THE64327.1 saccharopine dehydrogenase [Salinadaptatus halalkaliphilus]
MNACLVYGAYGYTGRLVCREAVSRGHTPIAAGRDGRQLAGLAGELGLERRRCSLEDDIASELADVDAVLNCAGPFVDTVDPLLEACLETGTDYLDVTGEVAVFERLRHHDAAARDAGIGLLPGVGFDVVPSDCLAAFLSDQLPTADSLTIGVKGTGRPSRGTARTLVDLAGTGGVVRRNDRLVRVPTAYRTRRIDFGDGPERAVTIPLGDVVTAAHHTGIETIDIYAAVPPGGPTAMRVAGRLGWLLENPLVERALTGVVDRLVDGPDARQRSTSPAVVWGEVTDGNDRGVRASLETPNVYTVTARAAVSAAERLVADETEPGARTGFQTPASAFGPDFVLELEGTNRERLERRGDIDSADRRRLESDD